MPNFRRCYKNMKIRKEFILRKAIVLIVFQLLIFKVEAQIVGNEILKYKNFTFYDKAPKYLVSSKSVIFMSVPRSQKDPTVRADWQKLSEKIHSKFKRMKIDPVGYYYLDEVFNNADPSVAFAKEMAAREIKYLILFNHSQNGAGATATDYYEIIVTPFNDKSTFIDQGANAWRVEGSNLNDVMKDMFNTIHGADLEVQNYLIPDVPEFFRDVDIIKGKRIPTYAMDLKVEKLIVPKFQKYLPKDSMSMDEDLRNRIRLFNQEIDRKNDKLAKIMESYAPLKYELSDDYSDKEVYNKGGQFVMLRLDGEGDNIRALLDYKSEVGETVYATIKATEIGGTVRRLPVDAVVSKFYVKHVYSKDVYTGLKWDADLTWEEALQNFIFNMKDVLKIK